MTEGGRAIAGTVAALGVYTIRVLPRIRIELNRWEERAARIPDPVLRAQALGALREKRANVEATGVFATLAPRRYRPAVALAGARLQIAVDYLDSLGERPGEDPLADGLRLHRALQGATTPGRSPDDPYRSHPQGEDGGYLADLVAGCARAAATLPRFTEVRPALGAALARCGEGQAHTHAAATGDPDRLRAWAEGTTSPLGYTWWEVAAGASSSAAAHAIIATAAETGPKADPPHLVDAAYFPPIGALTVLLDDLVDLNEDVAMGEHNYTSYYVDPEAMAERLVWIADRAKTATGPLRLRGRHEAILAGVIGHYMAGPTAGGAAAARRRLFESAGFPARALAAFSRLRNRA